MRSNCICRSGAEFHSLEAEQSALPQQSYYSPDSAPRCSDHLNCENYGGNPGDYLDGLFRTEEVHFIKTPEPHLESCLKRINRQPHICARPAFSTSIAAIGQLSTPRPAIKNRQFLIHFNPEKLEKYLLPIIFSINSFTQKSTLNQVGNYFIKPPI